MNIETIIPIARNPKVHEFRPGDTVNVSLRVREGERERIQGFEGLVIRQQGRGPGTSFTVRRVAAHGIGVERTFPIYSPRLEAVDIVRRGDVRRAKLFYQRERFGKASRVKEKRY